MATLNDIWIEKHEGKNPAIRLDWSNDRHQRIEIEGDSPTKVMIALSRMVYLIKQDQHKGNI